MKYLLDTNTASFAIRGVGRVGDRLAACNPDEIVLSAVTEAELYFGVGKRGSRRLKGIVEVFLAPLTILPFDSGAARAYGRLRVQLERRGETIGVADTMIAAQALAAGLVAVTNNTKHFRRVRGLRVEDWV